MISDNTHPAVNKSSRLGILAAVWIMTALVLLPSVTKILDGAFPIFTLFLLIVPLIAFLRNRDACIIGIRRIPWSEFLKYAALHLVVALALMIIFEPWSHTYQILLNLAVSSAHPDTTFGWLVRFPGFPGWFGFVFYAGFVTLFAEELFFRGWLLQWLQTRMSHGKAILWQSVFFTLPQLLAAFLLPPAQGILYAVIYSWLAIGWMGGWVASRTQSIWPSLASATIYNLLMALLVT